MLIKKLPIELVGNIIYYTSKKDIFTCQTVCKSWHKIFIHFIYDNVKIIGANEFQIFFYQTLNNSMIGIQIRKLTIENGHIEPYILGQLPLLCPYLQVFIFDGTVLSKESKKEVLQYYQQRKNQQELDKIKSSFIYWKDIRKIIERNGLNLTHHLLNQTKSKLSFIYVQFNNSNDKTNSKSLFINSLINAPLLKYLSIERIYISITELEKIHENCPNLTSLSLINCVFLPIIQQINSIKIAKNMNEIYFIDGYFMDTSISQWLYYIYKKYNYIKVLEIGTFISQDKFYKNQLLQIATQFTRLEILRMNSFVLGHSFFIKLDQKGTYLTELALGDDELNSIHLINDLSYLNQSQQIYSITSLTIHSKSFNTLTNGSNIIMNTIRKCINMTTLMVSMGTHMQPKNNMIPHYGTLYLDEILNHCPKLTDLTVCYTKLITTTEFQTENHASFTSSLTTSPFHLKRLNLTHVLFDSKNIFEMIRSRCPLLNQLELISTSLDNFNSRHLNIYLPQHELLNLTLDRVRISKKCSIRLGNSRFKITNSKETIWYDLITYECISQKIKARKAKITVHNANYSLDHNLNQSVYVAVQCKSIHSIYLTGLQVL